MISILSSSPKASSDGTATPPEPDTYTFRGYRWTKWDDCGFPDRVNHAVSTDGRSAYAIGGFSGLGKSRGTTAVESWNDLGNVPLDVLKFNTGETPILFSHSVVVVGSGRNVAMQSLVEGV